jgi:hypothetical protein
MKRLFLIAVLVMAAPAFAETAPPAPPPTGAPVSKDAKTDFTKPFVDDRLLPLRLKPAVDTPTVELKAGPGAR